MRPDVLATAMKQPQGRAQQSVYGDLVEIAVQTAAILGSRVEEKLGEPKLTHRDDPNYFTSLR